MLSSLSVLLFGTKPSPEEKVPDTGAKFSPEEDTVAFIVEFVTRGSNVKPLHSHNDFWRRTPLIEALEHGTQSVDTSVWHFPDKITKRTEVIRVPARGYYKGNWTMFGGEDEAGVKGPNKVYKEEILNDFGDDQIYVGHCHGYLDSGDTLDALYLDKIYGFLKSCNSEYKYTEASKQDQNPFESESKYGLFYNSPETPFYLWLDFKTDAHQTYHALQKYLKRFIDEDFLAYYDVATQTFHPGPVIITVTGNIPWDLIEAEQKRHVFVDAPLKDFAAHIDGDTGIASKLEKYSELCIFASASLQDLLLGGEEEFKLVSRKASFGDEINQRLKSIFDLAHTFGLKTRVWGDIAFPSKFVRGRLTDLYEAGTDLLNVEDLYAFEENM